MHRLLRKELSAATGKSEFVIALNLDIRGFSDWSLKVDSAQTALYLKKLYSKLIDSYFSSASFIKPTGDGLLVVEAIEEDGLVEALECNLKNCKEIVEVFGTLCGDEPMINFPVPEQVGIGLARGSASRLASAERTLDYSGHVLNLASRLMDLARPHGVVVDEGFGLQLVSDDLASNFEKHEVYLKGVAANRPIGVHCWPSEIQIPGMHLKPLEEEQWKHAVRKTTRREIESSSVQFYRFDLDAPPVPSTEVEGEVTHAAVTPGGRKAKGRLRKFSLDVSIDEVAGKPVARIDQIHLAKELKKAEIGPTWPVEVKISYRVS